MRPHVQSSSKIPIKRHFGQKTQEENTFLCILPGKRGGGTIWVGFSVDSLSTLGGFYEKISLKLGLQK